MRENKEYILLDFDFANKKKKLKVVLTYFNEIPKLDIREYYYSGDGLFKPTQKGVQLDVERAEALRAALQQNATVIDQHLISNDLETWASRIYTIQTSADFFSSFEFFKSVSKANKEEIVFNRNHPFGRELNMLENRMSDNDVAGRLMVLMKCLLITYNHSLGQFDDQAKVTVCDFIQDQNQMWSSLLKRIINSFESHEL